MRLHPFHVSTAVVVSMLTPVSAADLPSRKAAPVDYVRVCTIEAFTGFVIPGSDVCLKLGGFVRYDAYYTAQPHTFYVSGGVGGYGDGVQAGVASGRSLTNNTQQATASLQFDARTATEYGLLRAFADMRVVDSAPSSGFQQGPQIDKAYIQFSAWSFGKFQSFFDFYADAFSNLTGLGSDNSVVGAAYTAKLTPELFLTVALEDRGNTANVAVIGAPDATAVGIPGSIGGLAYGGARVPDAVAQLLYDAGTGGWGSAQLSAGMHQIRLIGTTPATITETRYGFAGQAGVKLNLPFIGEGDAAYLQAAYADGALSYIGAGNLGGLGNRTGGYGATEPLVAYTDAVAVGTGGSVKTARGATLLAAVDHVWTPTIDTSLYVGYTKVDYPAGTLTGATFAARDFSVLQVGGQVVWAPVAGLKIAGSVNWYAVNTQTKAGDYLVTAGGGFAKAVETQANGVQSLLRIQRDF